MSQKLALASSAPGRIRLREPALREPQRRARLTAALMDLGGMMAVEANPVTGSLLLRYDVTHCDRTAMEEKVVTLAAIELDSCTTPPRKMPARRATARQLNRFAKLSMLGCFPLSLGFVAMGGKHLHAVTGVMFSLAMMVHLAIHRRHLLK